MVERALAVVGLAGAILVALALTGALQHPAVPGAGAAQYCPIDQYGNQYGDCTDDTMAPLISTVVTPGPNDNGWNNTNVTLIFNATDDAGGTGVRSITCNLGGTTNGATRGMVFTASTVDTVVTCTAMDWAGNVSDPASKHIRIDKVRPSIGVATRTPAPDLYGWNYTDVTLVWPCSDAFSGVVSSTFTRTITTNGQFQTATGTCTDLAGNATSGLVAGINIDKTATVPTGGPPNDNIANATPVAALPFSDVTDTSSATREAHEPICISPIDDRDVWYQVTPTQTGLVKVSLSGNTPSGPVISVWRPGGSSGLQLVTCRPFSQNTFTAQAGVTYYVRIGSQGPGAGPFTVSLAVVPPPPNDAFANATPVDSLPFSDSLDLTAATTEPGEQLHPNGSLAALVRTAWYRLTAPQDEKVVLGGTTVVTGVSVMTVYTGSSFATLRQLVSSSQLIFTGTTYLAPLVFDATGGTTYFIQAGTFSFPSGATDLATIGVDRPIVYLGQTPQPNANGWNNTDVTLAWHCSSLIPFALSPIQTLFFEGRNQSAPGFCFSPFGGGGASDVEGGINIDKTPPVTTFQGRTPPANSNASGTFLSLKSTPGDYIGGGATYLFTQGDSTFQSSLSAAGDFFGAFVNQGNFSHWFSVSIAAPPGQPLAVGRYDNAVRASFRPPGVAGLDVSGNGRACTQVAGSFEVREISFTPAGELRTFDATFEQHCEGFMPPLFGRIRVDNSNPGAPVVIGWNNTDVTLDWGCTDSLSGVVDPSLSSTLTDEGGGQSATATCTDLADNSSSDTQSGIGIDKTPPNAPTAAADRAPEYPGDGGWFKDAVTVDFLGNGDPDGAHGAAGSGVDPGSLPTATFATQGSHTATGTVLDLAGNESTSTSLTVQVDTSAPDLTATFTKPDGSAYTPGTWTNQAVTATFHCSDTGGSGVASSSAPQTVLTQGTDQFVVGSCTDNVGHLTTQTFTGIDIDLTPPEGYLAFDPVTRDVQFFGRDQGGSGIAAGPVTPAIAPGNGNAQTRTYTEFDGAGNRFVLVVQAKPAVGLLQVSVTSLRYNAAAAIPAPFTSLAYSWSTNKDGSLKSLDQDLTVGKGAAQSHVLASYDASKNTTKVTDAGGSSTVAGLVLVKIATSSGALAFEY